MDPVGTIPLFLSTLKTVDPARRRLVLLREIGFAYVVLLACLFVGSKALQLLGLEDVRVRYGLAHQQRGPAAAMAAGRRERR